MRYEIPVSIVEQKSQWTEDSFLNPQTPQFEEESYHTPHLHLIDFQIQQTEHARHKWKTRVQVEQWQKIGGTLWNLITSYLKLNEHLKVSI